MNTEKDPWELSDDELLGGAAAPAPSRPVAPMDDELDTTSDAPHIPESPAPAPSPRIPKSTHKAEPKASNPVPTSTPKAEPVLQEVPPKVDPESTPKAPASESKAPRSLAWKMAAVGVPTCIALAVAAFWWLSQPVPIAMAPAPAPPLAQASDKTTR